MALLMFVIGGLYAGHAVDIDASTGAGHGAGQWVVIATIYVYVVIFCVTWAVHAKVYIAEIQPKRTRAAATGMAYMAYMLSNFTVALITPVMLAKTAFGAYILFGGCLALTAVVCWVFMPETRGKNLDEIEAAFHDKAHLQGLKRRLRFSSEKD